MPVQNDNLKASDLFAEPGIATLAGGGEMAALMREHDWSATPLGPVEDWSSALRMMTRFLLANRFPLLLWWGPDFCQLYNDAYRPILGTKHPQSLGQPVRQCWSEIWHILEPLIRTPFEGGPATWMEDIPLEINRYGFTEETHFTIAYSPVPDETAPRGIGGVLATVHEISEKVVGERRTRALRDLGAAVLEERSAEEACARAAEILANYPKDVPFSLIYLLASARNHARLASHSGVNAGQPISPIELPIGHDEQALWPIGQVIETGQIQLVEDLSARVREVPTGPWSDPPTRAAIVPIHSNVAHQLAGFLIAGLSPRLKFDDSYRGFLDLTSSQIATAIANARAYEDERQRAEALARLDRTKTLFFSNVSHEFRTPLTLMLGPIEDLVEKARERLLAEDREQLAVAHRNALRLLKLVNTLLDFSRIEAGRVQAVYEPTDLCSLTVEVASVFHSAMEKAGLRYSIDCKPLSEPIYIDREMWEKIVLNLLSNAFKFTFEGEISISLRDAGQTAEMTVRDTGVGIPEEELPRIFERFHRIEKSRARTHEGTGIGLAFVQELVKLHGGTVRVQSSVGEGSTFSISIPKGTAHLPAERIQAQRSTASTALPRESYIEEAERWLPVRPDVAEIQAGTSSAESAITPDSSPSHSSPEAPVSNRELIVLADDNADMRAYVARLLSSRYEVHAVPDGAQALESARRLRPAIVLTDIMMPQLDGFALLKSIRSDPELKTTSVIFLSARAGEESRVEGFQAGADDYLVKPFTARELLARVATHVKMAALRREAADQEARLRAQAELERHHLEELLAQAPAAIGFLRGPEHRWSYVNELYVKVTGRKSAADFVGKTIRQSLPEVEGQGYFELLDEVYRTGNPYVGRAMKAKLNRSHSGQPEEAYFNFVYQPIGGSHQQADGILVHAVEVTDQVLARKAVEISEERLRLAQIAAQIGTWEWDPIHNTSTLSPQLHKMFGTDANDPDHSSKWAARIHPDDLPRVQDLLRASRDSGTMDFEYRYLHPEAGLRWFHCKGRRLREDSRMLGVILDITARKQAEEARYRLAAIVESSDDAIVSKDLNGIVSSWNKSAERLFGYKAEEIIGRSITLIIPPELQQDEEMILSKIRRGEKIDHFQTVRLSRSGRRIDVSLTISPVRDEHGNVIGAAKIARDITLQKKAEQTLRMTERLASVGRLAATVAHEINNPLEAVTNFIYLAKNKAAQEDVRAYLTGAEEELERVAHLTKQTLGFYRDTKGAAPTGVATLLNPLLSVFAARIRNKQITVRTQVADDAEIVAVPGEISQLLAHLLSNSIDAVATEGHITLRVRTLSDFKTPRRRWARITIADSGCGIPAEHRPRLFEPFFTTKKDIGIGLGLWICKNIVEKQGGTIRVRSSATPGKSGTVFCVLLPVKEERSALAQEVRLAV